MHKYYLFQILITTLLFRSKCLYSPPLYNIKQWKDSCCQDVSLQRYSSICFISFRPLNLYSYTVIAEPRTRPRKSEIKIFDYTACYRHYSYLWKCLSSQDIGWNNKNRKTASSKTISKLFYFRSMSILRGYSVFCFRMTSALQYYGITEWIWGISW